MNALQKQALKKITDLVKGMHLDHPIIRPSEFDKNMMEEKTACWKEDEQARREILEWIKALGDSE